MKFEPDQKYTYELTQMEHDPAIFYMTQYDEADEAVCGTSFRADDPELARFLTLVGAPKDAGMKLIQQVPPEESLYLGVVPTEEDWGTAFTWARSRGAEWAYIRSCPGVGPDHLIEFDEEHVFVPAVLRAAQATGMGVMIDGLDWDLERDVPEVDWEASDPFFPTRGCLMYPSEEAAIVVVVPKGDGRAEQFDVRERPSVAA